MNDIFLSLLTLALPILYSNVNLFLTDQTWTNNLSDINSSNRWRILSLSCIFFPLLE